MHKVVTRVILVLAVLMLLLFVAAGLLLSRGKTLGERHQDFDETAFDYTNSSFADYIAYSRERLQAARLDSPSAAVIANMLPFELEPPLSCPKSQSGKAEKGVLLVHGLLAGPDTMRDFGEFLQSECIHVLGLLIPDHGSRPGDFLSTDWQHWAEATSFATRELSTKAERLILSGHSAGGTLAIFEAAQNPDVDALLLFAPALAITGAAKYAQFIVPIGKLFPKAAWFEVEPDEAIYRYESVTFTAAAETYALIQATFAAENENEHVRQLPVFTVASMEDNTVSTPAILEFMSRNNNERSHTLLYSQHQAVSALEDIALAAEQLKIVPSSTPEQGVLSVSHLGLMTPPSQRYYGQDGVYRSCGHYGSAANPEFVRCKNGKRAFYGETTAENLQQGTLERIAFNPYYNAMLADILEFLQ